MERDFKGVWIPKYIFLNSDLSALDKILLVEIDSLDSGEKGCFASNKYLAEFCQCSESAVSKSISKLIKLGLLCIKNFDGRRRELKSLINSQVKNNSQHSKIYEAACENLRDNNIVNNITNKIDNNICSNEQTEEKENTSNINTNKGQLFITDNKPKKKGENQFISVIEQLSSNNNVRDVLEEYYRFRCKKGLTIEQWKIIVEDFKNNSAGKNTEQIVMAVRDCLKFGNMSLFYRNENNFNTPAPTKNTSKQVTQEKDNSISFRSLRTFLYLPEEQRKECVKYLTPEQKEEYFSMLEDKSL